MLVAFLTDFGAASIYVGQMKAVLAGLAPGTTTLDLTHDIPPGPAPAVIAEGAFWLERSLGYLPGDAVCVCVVDPGVGTPRRVLAAVGRRVSLVGPDNGLLVPAIDALRECEVREVTASGLWLPAPSATFHGRDIFTPVAAHLARGLDPERLGPRLDPAELVRLGPAPPDETHGAVRAIDRFGNLVTDLCPPGGLAAVRSLSIDGHSPIHRAARTFAEGPSDEPFVTLGGMGTLEVCRNGASAAAALGVRRGVRVTIQLRSTDQEP